MRVGIDTNGFISIESLQDDGTFVAHSRSSYPVPQGSSYHLGINVANNAARVYSAPKVHLLEPEAPTMYFRYIESPDGVFHYPLFATAEEANYYDMTVQGSETGASHTHTYTDDPTNTTWYMPDHINTMTATEAPTNQTFDGQPVVYTEITSLTNADLTPAVFTSADLTYQEGTVVNMQLQPADTVYSTAVDIAPAGSGLVFNASTKMLQGTLADVASDTVYTVTVTRANSYGSSVGSFTITATDVAPPQTNDTPWTKALDFSGSNEHAKQVSNSQYANAMRMGAYGANVANNGDSTKTASSGYAMPWANTVVFRTDLSNSNQHIWNLGQGSGNSDKNIYLRTDASGNLYFGWGKGSDNNECAIWSGMASWNWYGVYIAHKGGRFSYGDLNVSNLADAFDIRIANASNSWNLSSNLSTTTNWTAGGNNARTDLSMQYDFTIGGRGSNRSFHGKVASMVMTTLKTNTTIPDDTEIKLMITDPVKWVTDYKVGNAYRWTNTTSTYPNFQVGDSQPAQATQVWLMGDGTADSYANGMRNYVQTSDQNWSKLQLNSMVSNDIQNVNINGLT